MKTIFKNKKISSILSILPENEYCFDDEINNYGFTKEKALRYKKITGANKHRVSKPTSTVSDFACFGLKYILDNNWVKKEDIGAIVVVSISPDYFVPHISNILHGEFNFLENVLCVDLSQGCTGFIQGLMESFMILDHMDDKKVILINGDLPSHKCFKEDTNLYPFGGDGATICIIENDNKYSDIYFELNYDGKRRDALRIDAGGFRKPSDESTKILRDMGLGVKCAEDHLYMNGTQIFNFVFVDVVKMIIRFLDENNFKLNDFDYFYFHQPNEYVLKELSDRLNIPKEKIPMNLTSNYGNTVSATIPMVIALNHKKEMLEKRNKCFLSAFGSGLSYGCIVMDIGELDHIEEIISNL